jgi:hypothetical protein
MDEARPLVQARSSVRLWVVAPLLVIALALCAIVLFAIPSLSKPLIMDEMEFRAVAKAIIETGKPISYVGETKLHNLGLWHPPLYITSLAAWMAVFGSSIASNRAYGLFNACLGLVLIGVFALRRWDWNDDAERGSAAKVLGLLIGLGVAATSPLLIQGSMLPDIDTQLLPLTISAFFLLMFELRRAGVSARVYWAAFVLALVVQLFAKLTTPTLLVPAFLVFELLQPSSAHRLSMRVRFSRPRTPANGQRPRTYRLLIAWNADWMRLLRTISVPILAGLAGLLLFIVLWYIVAALWGVDFRAPFLYLRNSTNNPANFASTRAAAIATIIAELPKHAGYLLMWAGIPLLAFLALMIVREFFKPADGLLSRAERAAIYTFALLVIGMYLILRPAPFHFPKYHPPLILPLGLLAIDLLWTLAKQRRFYLAAGVLGIQGLAYLLYIALTQPAGDRDFIHHIYYDWPKLPIYWRWMIAPLLVVFLANAAIWLLSRRRLAVPLLIGALAIIIGWQTSEALVQTRETYATTYYYGEESLNDVVTYLRANLPAHQMVIAPKDVGDQLTDHWRYFELGTDPRPILDRPNTLFLVVRSDDAYGHIFQATPAIGDAIAARFETVATIKNFTVMRRRP